MAAMHNHTTLIVVADAVVRSHTCAHHSLVHADVVVLTQEALLIVVLDEVA